MSSSAPRLAIVLLVAACSSKSAPPEPTASSGSAPVAKPPADASAPARLQYRVEAKVDDLGLVPFLVEVDPVKPEGWIVSPNERLPLVVIEREPLVLRIPVRGVELKLAADGASGRRRGQWLVEYYYKRDFDIVAEPVAATTPEVLFPGDAKPEIDLSGTFRVDIKDFGVGRAVFAQAADGRLDGTMIPPEVGDLRHLSGRVIGNTAKLSAFDGIHGFLVEMSSKDGGKTIAGRWLIAGIGNFPFTATREAAPNTHLRVSARMAPGKTRVSIPELRDPRFKGKPVIVDYFGSWCPVCIDMTPELVRLHRKHAADGLEILSIALEPEGDEAETQRRLDEFRKTFDITWPFVIRFGDDFHANLPRELRDATGFPVTLFLRRDHTVAAVHTGFISAAAKEEHAAVKALFDRLTAEIVASPTP